MPKITRATQKVFGDTAGAVNNFGIFGSLAAGTPLNSKDPAQIQSLAAWLQGLAGAVVGNKSPAFEDINSLFYVAFRQLAYLFQAGIAEWDAATVYYIGSQCQVAGVDYQSLTNDNTGNNPTTDTNNWMLKSSVYAQALYPVGEVYITRRSGNPASWLGFGTWVAYGAGKVPVFLNTEDSDFTPIDKTGGEKTHTLTIDEIPPIPTAPTRNGQAGANPIWANDSTVGGGQPHNNLQPYIVLAAWLRTA